MGFTDDLLTGLAQYLDGVGVGLWRPPPLAYEEDSIGIVLGVPVDFPPAQYALATYDAGDDPVTSDSVITVQVRMRAAPSGGNPGPVNDMADAAFDALQGLWAHRLPTGVYVGYASRTSSLPLGTDGTGRYERSDNYDLATHRPSPHRD